MTAKQLREDFEKDLKWLQDNCKHVETEILDYAWAPGHFSGLVCSCKNCEKILDNINANHS